MPQNVKRVVAPGEVLTAPRIYNTIIDQTPYLTQATDMVTWTESAPPCPTI